MSEGGGGWGAEAVNDDLIAPETGNKRGKISSRKPTILESIITIRESFSASVTGPLLNNFRRLLKNCFPQNSTTIVQCTICNYKDSFNRGFINTRYMVAWNASNPVRSNSIHSHTNLNVLIIKKRSFGLF